MKKGLFIGRLTKAAEWIPGRQGEFLSFDIAVSNGKDKDNNYKPSTFINCTMFDSAWAQGLVKYLTKGATVYVDGDPAAYAYINKEGKPVAGLRLSVRNLELVGGKAAGEGELDGAPVEEQPPATTGSAKSDDIPF